MDFPWVQVVEHGEALLFFLRLHLIVPLHDLLEHLNSPELVIDNDIISGVELILDSIVVVISPGDLGVIQPGGINISCKQKAGYQLDSLGHICTHQSSQWCPQRMSPPSPRSHRKQ